MAALLLIGGLELFFRFAAESLVKMLALGLIVLGVALIGWFPWRGENLLCKGLVVAAFTGYLVQATRRFPGLIKDPIPGDSSEIAVLAAKGALTLIVGSLAAAGAARVLRRALKSRSLHRAGA